jgi:hypothetical protein
VDRKLFSPEAHLLAAMFAYCPVAVGRKRRHLCTFTGSTNWRVSPLEETLLVLCALLLLLLVSPDCLKKCSSSRVLLAVFSCSHSVV